jgi:alkanesulfonate monooxygenase SsuD/methylene tetrahydromethanopterin reductase-like flavin-dependent oxidoreductase (luciferase family)
MSMKIGVQLPEVEYEIAFPDLMAMARLAEQVGFDSIWLGDHLLYDLPVGSRVESRGPWEVWTSLAALAASTERVELGPLVASTSFHAPAMLAKMAATVDAISGGRLVLGLGAGWNRREYDAFGFPYDHRVSRFEEAFTIVRTLLADGEIDFHGTYYDVDHAVLHPRSPRPGGPPIWVGSIRERMQAITLPHVHGWNVWWSDYGNTADGFAALKATVDARLDAIGRAGQVEATCAVYVKLPGGAGRTMGEYPVGDVRPIEGPSDEIADQLRAFADAGAAHVQLVVDPIVPASIELLGPVLEAIRAQ